MALPVPRSAAPSATMRPRRRTRRPRSNSSSRRPIRRTAGRKARPSADLTRYREELTSRDEHDFADIAPRLDMGVRRRGFGEGKGAIDDGIDLALRLPTQDVAEPAPHRLLLAPEMAEIDAEETAIGIHQRQGRQAQPGNTGGGAQQGQPSSRPIGRRGEAERAEPPQRRQAFIALPPGAPADGVEREVDAASLRQRL